MKAIRFIAFISRRSEIEGYLHRKPDADFVFASFSDLGGDAVKIHPDRPQEMVALFSELHAEHPFAGVLNRKEKCVIPAATLANGLGIRPILSDPLLARDKYRMRLALNADDPFPRSILVSAESDITKVPDDMFPCVVKPRFGFNSRSVFLARNREELRKMVDHQFACYSRLPKQDGTNSDFVVEDLVTGSEHTIESLVKDGEALFYFMSDKEPMTPPFFVEVGDLMPSRLPAAVQEKCRMATVVAIERIGVRNGWTHTELKLHDGRPIVIECAARMGGGYFEQLISEVYGIDRMRTLIDLHLDLPLPLQPQPQCHIAARRVVLYGVQQVIRLDNHHEIFSHDKISLVWPNTVEDIPRLVVGPPHDFNNTVFEFFARGDSAVQAAELADDTQLKARVVSVASPDE